MRRFRCANTQALLLTWMSVCVYLSGWRRNCLWLSYSDLTCLCLEVSPCCKLHWPTAVSGPSHTPLLWPSTLKTSQSFICVWASICSGISKQQICQRSSNAILCSVLSNRALSLPAAASVFLEPPKRKIWHLCMFWILFPTIDPRDDQRATSAAASFEL